MRVLMYDPFAGISGDMHIGAMADLGVPKDYMRDALSSLHVSGWSLEFTTDMRKGITGTHAHVHLEEEKHEQHHHGHDHDHEHEHHEHKHEKNESHEHRNFGVIRHIIESSHLNDHVKELSLKMFRAVAEAEAKVHNKPIDEVHFHEVGALDSIVDIIAAAVAIDYLKPDRIISTSPELGGGFVHCAHGKIPVPAPATVEILKGIPTRSGAVLKEMTTPTGAAILATVVDEFVTTTDLTFDTIGYGIGSRDTEIPNVLRVYLGEIDESRQESVSMIETNIDDMSPEVYTHVSDLLWAAGAKEVYITPVIMKKGRPGNLLSIMSTSEKRDVIYKILFTETTTAGVREYPVKQTMLERSFSVEKTPYGDVRVKKLTYKGAVVSTKPEADDMKRIAVETGMPLKRLYEELSL